jgi:hypothetical protein
MTADKQERADSVQEPRTYEDYKKLRKSNPHAFYSLRVQQRMVKDAETLGDSFWKSDTKEWWR